MVKGLTVREGEAVLSQEVTLKPLVQELVLVCMGEQTNRELASHLRDEVDALVSSVQEANVVADEQVELLDEDLEEGLAFLEASAVSQSAQRSDPRRQNVEELPGTSDHDDVAVIPVGGPGIELLVGVRPGLGEQTLGAEFRAGVDDLDGEGERDVFDVVFRRLRGEECPQVPHGLDLGVQPRIHLLP